MKRKRFSILKLIVVLLLLFAITGGFIQTPAGKSMLVKTISTMLSRSENLDIEIGSVSGWIPWNMQVDQVSVGDAGGIWLTVRKLDFRWIMRELADGRIRLRRLGADEVVWHRLPESKGNGKKEQGASIEIGQLEILLDGLNIQRFALEKGVAGTPLEYSVDSGGITLLASGRLSGQITVGGDAEGVVYMDAFLSGKSDQYLKLKAELNRILKPTFGLDHLSGQGEATISASGVEALITAKLKKGAEQGHIETGLRYGKRTLGLEQFYFVGAGYELQGDMKLGFGKGTVDVELDTSFDDVHTNTYGISAKAMVATSNKTWTVDLNELQLSGFDVIGINVAGKIAPEKIALTAVLDEITVANLPLVGATNFTGMVNGDLHISGTLEKPEVVTKFSVAGFGSSSSALDELPELDFSISGGISAGMLHGATAITKRDGAYLAADMQLPCAFSFFPFRFLPVPKEISGHLEAQLELGILNRLAMFQAQFIDGSLETKVDYTDGVPAGFLRLKDGQYEHYDMGVVFKDFQADLEATSHGFKIRKASATDGESGRVEWTGGFGKGGLDLKLSFEQAEIVHRDEIDASISGALAITGRLGRPNVAGTLVVDRAEILLDNIPAALPAVLSDFDASLSDQAVKAESRDKPTPFGLDVKIDIPEQTFLIAAMIEAVLQGNLKITDTSNGISIKGKIEPRRGYVNFIGKKFRFIRGSIRMDGSVPMKAFFDDLTAEYERRDVTARLILNGPVGDPRFRLESTPALPEDEVLSHVLFNRDTSSISPYQAYQIAAAARQLSGGLSGPGFMYGVRRAVGVDTFEIREAEVADESSSVAAGKYLTSDLYIEVNQSLESEGQTGMMAEYEITRHFSIETSTGPSLRPGIGINWKTDY